MVEAPSVTLEEFARLTAQIDGGEPVERVLSGTDLEPAQWAEVQRTWLQRMAHRATQGKPSLHKRFVELLEEHRRELEAARRADKTLDGPLPRPPEERKAPVLVQRRAPVDKRAVPSPPRPPALRRPSPPQVPAAPPQPAQAAPQVPRRLATSAMRAIAPPGEALPFAEEPAALPFKRPSPAPADGDHPALPFRPEASASAACDERPSPLPFRADVEAPAPPPADLGPEPASLGATMAMSAEDFSAARAALLPFLKQKEDQQGESAVDLGSTAYVSPEEMAKARAALPFGAPPDGASSDGSLAETAEIPPKDEVPIETAEVPPDQAPAGPALPFASPAAPAATGGASAGPASTEQPTLSLEQYAWLCATLERSAGRAEETLTWLRMSAEQKAELDRRWRAAMERDRALWERFDALRRSYLSQG